MLSYNHPRLHGYQDFIASLNFSHYAVDQFMNLSNEEIIDIFKQIDGEITLTCYPTINKRLVGILLNDQYLLHKLSGITLSWLTKHPEAVEIILNNNSLIQKTEKGSLAVLVRDQGMKVWEKIIKAKIIFEDGNHLCWIAEKQKEIALDIIDNNDYIRKIVNELLNYNFYQFEEVALKLLDNPVFIELSSSHLLYKIALCHESCSRIIYNKRDQITQIRNFNNQMNDMLEKKYPSIWVKEDRPLDSSKLKFLAEDANALREAIAHTPDILNVQDEHGKTILHYFSQLGFLHGSTTISNIYAVLRTAPYNLMIRDNNGNTPLHIVSSYIHDRVTSSYIFPLLLRLAIEQNFDFTLTNNSGKTVQDILRENITNEYYYRRYHRINPALQGILIPSTNVDPINQALELSFNFNQPINQSAFNQRDEISVMSFIKMELGGEQGVFNENLNKKSLAGKLEILNYLIDKFEKNIKPDQNLENVISELDDFCIFTSLQETIKRITGKYIVDDSIIKNITNQIILLLKILWNSVNESMKEIIVEFNTPVAKVDPKSEEILEFTAENNTTSNSGTPMVLRNNSALLFQSSSTSRQANNTNPASLEELRQRRVDYFSNRV